MTQQVTQLPVRLPGGNTGRLKFTAPVELLDWLGVAAYRRGLTVSAWIVVLLTWCRDVIEEGRDL